MSVRALRSVLSATGAMLALGVWAMPARATVIHEGTDSGTSDDVHGPHPGFAEDFPFCEIAATLTGA